MNSYEVLGVATKAAPYFRDGLVAVLGSWADDSSCSGGTLRIGQRRDGAMVAHWSMVGVDTFRGDDGARSVALLLRGTGDIQPGDEMLLLEAP